MEALVFVFVLYAIVFGSATRWLAQERGRSGGYWFVSGAFFGPMALLALGFAPLGSEGDFRACPECLESVRAMATTCPHCGTDLIAESEAETDDV